MSETITIRIPVSVARFLYSAIENYIEGNLMGQISVFNPELNKADRVALVEFSDNLAVEISMTGGRR